MRRIPVFIAAGSGVSLRELWSALLAAAPTGGEQFHGARCTYGGGFGVSDGIGLFAHCDMPSPALGTCIRPTSKRMGGTKGYTGYRG